MKHSPSLHLVVGLALAGWMTTPSANAQFQTNVNFEGTVAIGADYRLRPLELPVETPFGRSVALDMDGDLMMDHAVIVDRVVRTLFAPGLFEAPVGDVQDDVDGIGVLQGRGVGVDRLLAAGPFGVRSFVWRPDGLDRSQIHDEPALAVAPIPTPLGAPRQVAILLADGRSVVLANEVVFGNRQTWDHCLWYQHRGRIYDLAVADLGGDGRHELCLSVDGGVHIERPGREPLVYTFPFLRTTAMTILGEPGQEQWMACVVEYIASGNELIAVFDDEAIVDLEAVNGGVGMVGIAGADTSDDGDGLLDLSVSWKGAYDVAQVEGIVDPSAGPQFDVLDASTISIIETGVAPPSAGHTAWPEVVDVDNDGDPDTILPIQQDGSIFVYLCAQQDEAIRKPWIVQDESLMFRLGPTIELHMGIECDPSTITNGSPTAFEVIVYRRPSPSDPVRTDPIHTDIINFAATTDVGNGILHFDCVVPFLETPRDGVCTSFDSMYWIVVRMVETSGAPGADLRVVKRFPARLYGVEGQVEGSENWEFIDEHQPSGLTTLIIQHECLETQGAHALTTLPFLHDHNHDVVNSESGGSGKELPCLPGPMDDKKVPLTKKQN